MENKKFITTITIFGKKYFLKLEDDLSEYAFYEKNEEGNFIYVGYEKNQNLQSVINIDDKKVYTDLKYKKIILILGLNIILTTTTGFSFNINKQQPIIKNLKFTTEQNISNIDANLFQNYIIKYDMGLYRSMLIGSEKIFNETCFTVEQNHHLPYYVKKEIIRSFPRLVIGKEYIDFKKYFKKLSLLKYEEIISKNNINYHGYYTTVGKGSFKSPKIVITSEKDKLSTIYHEVEHFNGSRDDYLVDANVCLLNNKFHDCKNKRCNGKKIPIKGRTFEEGLVSIFTMRNAYSSVETYYDEQKITELYTLILGQNKILEAHHSEEKVVKLMNETLKLDFTVNEVIEIFSRLNLYFSLNNKYDATYKQEFIKYQIVEDIISIYEKKYNRPYTENLLFTKLLHEFIGIGYFYLNQEDFIEVDFKPKYPELLNTILNNEIISVEHLPFKIKQLINNGFEIRRESVNSNLYNVLNDVPIYYINLNDVKDIDQNEYKSAMFYYKIINNKYVLKDYNIKEINIIEENSKVKNESKNNGIKR